MRSMPVYTNVDATYANSLLFVSSMSSPCGFYVDDDGRKVGWCIYIYIGKVGWMDWSSDVSSFFYEGWFCRRRE